MFFGIASGPPLAHADNVRAAKRMFRRAERSFAAKDYGEALRLYLEAYQHKPLPGFLFNIAQCYRYLGRYDKAIEHIEAYLARSRNADNRRAAELVLAECRERLEAERAAAAPRQATEPRGSTTPGSSRENERASAETSAPRGEERGGELRAARVQPPSPPRASPVASGPGLSPIYFWSGVGLTSALAIAATVSGVITIQRGSEFDDPATPREDLQGIKDSGESWRTAANVTFGLTLASAAATTVLFFFSRFTNEPNRPAITAAPGAGALVLKGWF